MCREPVEPVEIVRAAARPDDGGDADDQWFEGAARDTLSTATSSSTRDAVGSAALTLERELVRRPATRRRWRPSAERTRGELAGRGRAGLWAIGAVALVVAVLAVAVLSDPVQRSADHRAAPTARTLLAGQAPPAVVPPAASRARLASPVSRRGRRRARRTPSAATASTRSTRAAARPGRTRRAHATAPTSASSPQRPPAAAGRVPARARPRPPAFTPGDLPLARSAP